MAERLTLVTTGLKAENSAGQLIDLDTMRGTDPAITCPICMEEIGSDEAGPGYVGHKTIAATVGAVAQDHFYCKACMAEHERSTRENHGRFRCPTCQVHLNATEGPPNFTARANRPPRHWNYNPHPRFEFEREIPRWADRIEGLDQMQQGLRPQGRETYVDYLARLRAETRGRAIAQRPVDLNNRLMHATSSQPSRSYMPTMLKLPASISRITGMTLATSSALTYGISTLAVTVGIIALGIIFLEFLIAAIITASITFIAGTIITYAQTYASTRFQNNL